MSYLFSEKLQRSGKVLEVLLALTLFSTCKELNKLSFTPQTTLGITSREMLNLKKTAADTINVLEVLP